VGPRVGWWAPGERGPATFKQKLIFPSSPLHVWGKKKEEQCRSKRHRSALFFFFDKTYETASFHLNVAPERANFQISPQLSFV
jgi:hypothetical protein